MKTKKNHLIDPMLERTPEAFHQLNTFPGGWDMSEFLEPPRQAKAGHGTTRHARHASQSHKGENGRGELSA
jgi:hypothetical protein